MMDKDKKQEDLESNEKKHAITKGGLYANLEGSTKGFTIFIIIASIVFILFIVFLLIGS